MAAAFSGLGSKRTRYMIGADSNRPQQLDTTISQKDVIYCTYFFSISGLQTCKLILFDEV